MTSTTTFENLLRQYKPTRPKCNRNYEPLLNTAQQIYLPLANHRSEKQNEIEILGTKSQQIYRSGYNYIAESVRSCNSQ